jgi:hypothetical protein
MPSGYQVDWAPPTRAPAMMAPTNVNGTSEPAVKEEPGVVERQEDWRGYRVVERVPFAPNSLLALAPCASAWHAVPLMATVRRRSKEQQVRRERRWLEYTFHQLRESCNLGTGRTCTTH